MSASPALRLVIPSAPAAPRQRGTQLPLIASRDELPADDRALVNYNEWLFYERRMLLIEMFPDPEQRRQAEALLPHGGRGASEFHFPSFERGGWEGVPKPSTRAAAVLDLVGVDWREVGRIVSPAPCGRADASPDADLLRLFQEWEAASAASDKAWEEWEEAADRRVFVTPPEALFTRRTDFDVRIIPSEHHESGRGWYGDQIDFLRTVPRTRSVIVGTDKDCVEAQSNRKPTAEEQAAWEALWENRPWPEAQARADEIVAAWDQWLADQKASDDACGYTAAEALRDQCTKEETALRVAIAAVPANSIEGVVIKARLAAACLKPAEMERDLADDLNRGYASGETLALAVVRDLLQMQVRS